MFTPPVYYKNSPRIWGDRFIPLRTPTPSYLESYLTPPRRATALFPTYPNTSNENLSLSSSLNINQSKKNNYKKLLRQALNMSPLDQRLYNFSIEKLNFKSKAYSSEKLKKDIYGSQYLNMDCSSSFNEFPKHQWSLFERQDSQIRFINLIDCNWKTEIEMKKISWGRKAVAYVDLNDEEISSVHFSYLNDQYQCTSTKTFYADEKDSHITPEFIAWDASGNQLIIGFSNKTTQIVEIPMNINPSNNLIKCFFKMEIISENDKCLPSFAKFSAGNVFLAVVSVSGNIRSIYKNKENNEYELFSDVNVKDSYIKNDAYIENYLLQFNHNNLYLAVWADYGYELFILSFPKLVLKLATRVQPGLKNTTNAKINGETLPWSFEEDHIRHVDWHPNETWLVVATKTRLLKFNVEGVQSEIFNLKDYIECKNSKIMIHQWNRLSHELVVLTEEAKGLPVFFILAAENHVVERIKLENPVSMFQWNFDHTLMMVMHYVDGETTISVWEFFSPEWKAKLLSEYKKRQDKNTLPEAYLKTFIK